MVESLAVRFYPPILCTHVVAEFFYGLAWAKVPAEAFLEAREFIESFEILSPGLLTASIYARLRAEARRAGRQLPDPDFWIAAHAIESRLLLVTADRHFTAFEELNLHLLK